MADLLTYQTYPNQEVAQSLLDLLDAEGVEYEADYAAARFSAPLGITLPESFVVRLRPEEFSRVRALEEARAAESLGELPSDYYLFSFSNAELWDLLKQPDAWSSRDVALAMRLLRERGENVSAHTLQDLRTWHTATLAAPDPSPTGWIVLGYVSALLGGLFGIGVGWSLRRYNKTLPDGRQVPGYAPADRAHGLYIMVIGAVSLVGWALGAMLGR